jgi:signal transduction histidine kinase
MEQNLVSPRKATRSKATTLASRIAALEAENATLRQTNAKLQQQLQDSEIELKATIDEFLRAEEETEAAKRETERAKEEAERANTVKSAFLASMSHELRTPLNAVLNFSQFISSGMLGEVNNEQIDMLEKITSSGKHLLNLINDVLDISKIESGSLRLFVEPNVDLVQEVKTVADIGRALLKDKQVELKLDIPADVPKITADRRRIRQVLLNLVSNACKFTDAGEVSISVEKHDQEVRVLVKDTGPGIAAQDHNTIFEAFRQTDAGIRQGAGTGLGLAISRRLAEAHGGKLWLESQLGAGATFFVAIPLKAVAPATKPEAAHAN